jgi:hypothetical protein
VEKRKTKNVSRFSPASAAPAMTGSMLTFTCRSPAHRLFAGRKTACGDDPCDARDDGTPEIAPIADKIGVEIRSFITRENAMA